jgi:hypothetical protein
MKQPTAHLPGCGNAAGKVAIGSPRAVRALETDAALRQRALASSGISFAIAREPVLVLPRRWLSRFWPFANGTLLARASGNHGTFPEMYAAEQGAIAAFRDATKWRRALSAWPSPKAPRAILLEERRVRNTYDHVPIPRGTYDIDKAVAKARGLDYVFYRFVRAGEKPSGSPFPGAAPAQPALSVEHLRAGKKLPFVDPGEASLVFGDAERLDRWTGADGFGTTPCDYDLICDAKGKLIADGRVFILDEIGAVTWFANATGGVLVGLVNVDDAAIAAAAGLEVEGSAKWTATKYAVKIGERDARLLNSTDRGDSKKAGLRIALAPGRYAIDHAEHDEVYFVRGRRSAVSIELFRVRRTARR